METLKRLKLRLKTANQALNNLTKAIDIFLTLQKNNELFEYLRESVIKRFEYSLELFWKLLRDYLEEIEGSTVPASPRGVINEALRIEFITAKEAEILNNMIDDRNLSSHAYHEDIAAKITTDVISYLTILNKLKNSISSNINKFEETQK